MLRDRPAEDSIGSMQLPSIFLRLQADWVEVAVSRPGHGGGLTSLGQDVLLLTHDGVIHAARSTREVRTTALRTPDNGYSKLEAAAQSDRLGDVSLDLTRVRYNDILHYQTDSLRGLAISYTDWDDEARCYTNTVATLPVPQNVIDVGELSSRPSDWRRLFTTSPCLPLKEQFGALEGHMAGGRMAFAPPQTLVLTSGDYGWDGMYAPEVLAQDPASDYGKFIAIDLVSGDARHVSSGHRNPQGIVFDATGQLWGLEHGPYGGDELNRIVEGRNYGWPATALGTQYSRLPLRDLRSSYGRHDLFEPPTYAFLPSVGASNITLVDGFHDAWDDDLLAASLRRGSLFRVRLDGRVVRFAEEIPVGESVRYVHQHEDGRLVLWTDSHRLFFVSVSDRAYADDVAEELLARMDLDDRTRNAVRTAWTSCLECHSLEPGASVTAPTLAAVFEGPVAGTSFDYSQALRDVGGQWTRGALRAYLSDPSSVAPGTRMPDPQITDGAVLDAVIDLLEGIRNTAETAGGWAEINARSVIEPR
jgi:cytochrome c2